MSKAKNIALEITAPVLIFFTRMKTIDTDKKISLPGAVARYFEASNRFDAESAAACFAPNAIVRDEGHTQVGRDAIKVWVSQTSENYRPQTTVIGARENGDKMTLDVRVVGQFPGSPVDLKFEFSLRNDAIVQLTIQPAN
jgi:hypothetical protein